MPSTPVELYSRPAPAKLNPFLHVVGYRPDDYHLLQTVSQLIGWGDTLHFTHRPDRRLVHITDILGVLADDDLVIRAARLSQTGAGCTCGVDIAIEKRLPTGGGLGGGSSDAATTLLVPNHLWGLDLPRAQLIKIGLKLGANVPFFIFGQNAFAEGIGGKLTPITLSPAMLVVIHPRVYVPTPATFSGEGLTHDMPPTVITDFPDQQIVLAYGRNDLQAVVKRKYGEVARALIWLHQFNPLARMTGSGACVFTSFDNAKHVQAVVDQVPSKWEGWCATGLTHHPLARFAVQGSLLSSLRWRR